LTDHRARPLSSRSRRATLAASALALGAASAVLALPAARAAYRPSFVARRFAVATDNRDASEAAAEVLRAGGNAADAAVAAALALGVVSNASSGFGGGGFATVCSAQGVCTFLDFREVAPSALTAEVLQRAPDPARASVVGGLAVGVPGEPAGLLELSRRFGHLPLARATAPAVALARRGFMVSGHLADRIGAERVNLALDRHLAGLFLPGGNPVAAGTRLRRPILARTLERYGREGERFVRGAFADAVAATVRGAGGVMTADDVRAYRPVERAPLARAFRDVTVVTAPPPSAGGIILLEALAWVEAMPAAQLLHGSSAYDHLLAEAFRGGFDDRARYVGDPGAGPSVADALLDPARLARRRAAFDPAHARPVVVIEPARDHGTTHLCVVDGSGMMVSLTTTVNLAFGARLAVPELDVVLNDEIDDFSLGTSGNNFGLASSRPNALAPGRRPVSSMSPTIVLRGRRPVACVGASGGPRIATATTQVLLNLVLHGMDPEAAVSAPRIHHQGLPDQLLVDAETPEDVRVGLRARGHQVSDQIVMPLGVAQSLQVREHDGRREVLAASDPRKGGLPAGE
jgi:gamma-glutamyltranspeptidase/glutathione hydrolase